MGNNLLQYVMIVLFFKEVKMDNPTLNQQGNQINQPAQPKPTDQGQPQPVQPAPTQPSTPAPVNQPPPTPPAASSPAPAPPPAPPTNQAAQSGASPASQTPMQAPKKGNTGLIVALVIVGLLIVLGGGGYFGYRYLANRLNSAITSNASTETNGSSSTGESIYSQAKDNTPTDALTIQVNNDLKPILEKLYGGAKLSSWLASEGTTTSMAYTLKNKATSADYANLEQALIEKGYTKKENVTTDDGFMISFYKADVTITLTFQSNLPYEIIVGAEKTSV